MSKKTEEKKKSAEKDEKRRKFRFGTVLILIAFVFVAVKFSQQYQRIDAMRQEAESYQAKYDSLVEEQAKLKEEKDLLNDPTYIERIAREKLGLVKEGEVLVLPAEEKDDVEEYNDDVEPGDIH